MDHRYLKEGDVCFYLFEYTSKTCFKHSTGNELINNLKKSPNKKDLPEYKYKLKAMKDCSEHIASRFNLDWLKEATLVPVPPSKVKGNLIYDDRMLQICNDIPVDFKVKVKELIVQTKSTTAAHKRSNRPNVEELIQIYSFNKSIVLDAPSHIGIVDDLLTTGAHFRAMKEILNFNFPGTPIVGIFIARRIFPTNYTNSIFR